MRKHLLIALLGLLALLSCRALADASVSFTATQGTFDYDAAREAKRLTDDFRTSDTWYWNSDDETKTTVTGLSAFTYSYVLEDLAMRRAAELAMCYSHMRPDGSHAMSDPVFDSWYWGENIAYGYYSYHDASAVMNGWIEEDKSYSGQGHRRNILNTGFRTIGIGCFRLGGYTFWAQEFGGSDMSIGSPTARAMPLSYGVIPDVINAISLPTGKDALLVTGESRNWSDQPVVVNGLTGYLDGASFASNDTSVLQSGSGRLTGVGAGTADVTITVNGTPFESKLRVDEYGSCGDFDVEISGDTLQDGGEVTIHVYDAPSGTNFYYVESYSREAGWEDYRYYYDDHFTFRPADFNGGYDDTEHIDLIVYACDGDGYDLGIAEMTLCFVPEEDTLRLPGKVRYVESEAFRGTPAARVEIPGSCDAIGANAFAGCTGLRVARIPGDVTSIDSTAFAGCSGLIIETSHGSAAARFAQQHRFEVCWIDE